MDIPQYIEPQDLQPHVRIVLRHYIKELMIKNTDLGGRWFASRPNPRFLDSVPCGLIYFTDEPSVADMSPRIYKNSLMLTLEVLHRMDSERENALDDWLDSRAYEIFKAMTASRFLGMQGIVQDCKKTREQPVTIETEGDDDIGGIRCFYEIKYNVGGYDNRKLNEFLSFVHTIKNPDGAELSKDEVTIRTT